MNTEHICLGSPIVRNGVAAMRPGGALVLVGPLDCLRAAYSWPDVRSASGQRAECGPRWRMGFGHCSIWRERETPRAVEEPSERPEAAAWRRTRLPFPARRTLVCGGGVVP
jgi:hypothetical protein